MEVKLDKQGDGRFGVHLDGRRIGLVLGGRNKWAAEAGDGSSLGIFGTRREAQDALVCDATHPVWADMLAKSDAAGLPRHYKTDLKIDRQILREWHGLTDFVWVLRENGTHLVAIDADWTRREELAVLQTSQVEIEHGRAQVYLVPARSSEARHQVERITVARAKSLLTGTAIYSLDATNRTIVHHKGGLRRPIADIDASQMARAECQNGWGEITVKLREDGFDCEAPVLISAAFAYLTREAQSLFATPTAIGVVRGNKLIDQWKRRGTSPA